MHCWLKENNFRGSLLINIDQSGLTRLRAAAAAAAKLLQSCLTLCDPINVSPSGSSILGILQARTLEWVAISFSEIKSQVPDLWTCTEFYIRYLSTPNMFICLLTQAYKWHDKTYTFNRHVLTHTWKV